MPNKTIAYTDIDGTTQAKSWKGAIYMVENQTKGYIAAIINGGLGGGYSLLGYTPESLLNTIRRLTHPALLSAAPAQLAGQLHHLRQRLERLAKLGRRPGQSGDRQSLP